MLIYNDTFAWEGFGGKLKLGSGECLLRIIDRRKTTGGAGLAFVKPYIVVVSDATSKSLSVKSCAGHIATLVTQKFSIAPNRMYYVEFYEKTQYGGTQVKTIPERFETVEFEWFDEKAINPRWRPADPVIIDVIKTELNLITDAGAKLFS